MYLAEHFGVELVEFVAGVFERLVVGLLGGGLAQLAALVHRGADQGVPLVVHHLQQLFDVLAPVVVLAGQTLARLRMKKKNNVEEKNPKTVSGWLSNGLRANRSR